MEQQQESSTTTLTKSQEEELSSILSSGVGQITEIEKSLRVTLAQQTINVLHSIEQFVEEQSSLLDILRRETHEYVEAANQRSTEPAEDMPVMASETTKPVTTQEKDMDIALSGFEGDSG